MSMTAGEKNKMLMSRKGGSIGDMADQTEQSRKNLSNKMKRNNFCENEIAAMAAVLGYKVEIHILDENGDIVL